MPLSRWSDPEPAELTELGHQLYTLLARFDGYVAAKVGWNPEGFLELSDLKSDWTPDELSDGSIHGLVLSEALHAELGLGDDYVTFRPGYRWVPYRGEKPRPETGGRLGTVQAGRERRAPDQP